MLSPGMLVSPDTAAEAGALVLLGEPGVGKTTVFDGLTAGLLEAGEAGDGEPARLLVDGAELTDSSFEAWLGRYLSQLPEQPARGLLAGHQMQDASHEGHRQATLTLVLDQLDECPMLPRLAAALRRALKRRDTSALRLLVGCRTADYPSELTEVFSQSFGRCFLADLAPLTRTQAEVLAGSCGIDGVALVGAAVAAGAGALASVPLTLELLVKVYREHGQLEGRPSDLFAQGVRLLADEPDPARRRGGDQAGSVDQRLAIARRVAARLLLCGGRTVWQGRDLDAGRLDLPAGGLAGGFEWTPSGQFEVHQAVVSATLGTALFTGTGEDRLAFRHSSLAAYLAASYLRERQVPRAQLRSLFLVAGAAATTSIPPALRETTAWLVTLDPSHSQWLAEADPTSLAGHSAIVDSAEIRRLVVDALLAHASEIELGDPAWLRARWRLDHAGLAQQLTPVLTDAAGGEPEDWQAQARVRLAVRLAQQATAPELAEPLLALAEHDGWQAYVRQLAARAAFAADRLGAVPRLRALLGRLGDETYAVEIDPDDQLRGVLLDLLWPGYLKLDEVLRQLRPRRRRYFVGSYLMFLHAMPKEVAESDLELLLSWTRDRVAAVKASDSELPMLGTEPGVTATTPIADGNVPDAGPSIKLDMELVQAIVDRALSGPSAPTQVDNVAAILWPYLVSHDHIELPRPVDVVDAEGNEPDYTRRLRRALARALTALAVQEGGSGPGFCWPVVRGWRGRSPSWGLSAETTDDLGLRAAQRHVLVNHEDFSWALDVADEASASGDEQLAKGLGALAFLIFDPADLESHELACRRQNNPAWQYLRQMFEAVPLDSDYARMMRDTASSASEQHQAPWPEAERFKGKLHDRLSAAVAGDTDAFWRLLWELQIEPATGRLQTRLSDDLFSLPAMPLLGEQAREKIREAAVRYLQAEHDHADSWLGTTLYDRRAWAGYLALTALDGTGRLDQLPLSTWTAWIGAIVWFPATSVNVGRRDRKERLLAQAAVHASSELARAVARLVRGELARGQRPFHLELVDPAWSRDLAETFAALVRELSDALGRLPDKAGEGGELSQQQEDSQVSAGDVVVPDAVTFSYPVNPRQLDELEAIGLDSWELMLRRLLAADLSTTLPLAQSAIAGAGVSARHRRLAVRAARVLLITATNRYWPEIYSVAEADRGFSRELALACAIDDVNHVITGSLDEAHVGDLYRWLTDLFPHSEDTAHEGAHMVGPEDEARDWRDRVLRVLAERGTEAAISTLTELASESPNQLGITAALLVARAKVQASAWSPPSAAEVATLLSDKSRRLVRDSAELATLLLDTLTAVRDDLPPHAELLWDRHRPAPADEEAQLAADASGDLWQPKPEAALSAYLAHELTLRLRNRSIAVNREVLIQPSNAYGAGDRTDIKADALAIHDLHGSWASASPDLTVVIEVKGAWNPELMTDQRDQLARRYLPEARTDTGIYVVGWYPPSLWNDPRDHRRSAVMKLNEREVEPTLREQASEIELELNVHVHPMLLTMPRPQRAQPVATNR